MKQQGTETRRMYAGYKLSLENTCPLRDAEFCQIDGRFCNYRDHRNCLDYRREASIRKELKK